MKNKKSKASILHMSDFHFGDKKIKNSWGDETTLRKFNTFITKLENKPDFLVISGDVGSKGKDAPDYIEAIKIIGKLCDNILNIKRERVIITPGNHDVDLGNPMYPFNNFIHFIREFYSPKNKILELNTPQEELFSIFESFTENYNLLFVCANSCIRIISEKNYGLLGNNQINNIKYSLSKLSFSKDIIKIFVIHHSLCPVREEDQSALRDQTELKEFLKDNDFSILLHGHQHFEEIYTLGKEKHKLLVVGTGHIFERPEYKKGFPSFNILTFHNLDEPKKVTVSIKSCIYNDNKWEFRKPYSFSTDTYLKDFFNLYPNIKEYAYEYMSGQEISAEYVIKNNLKYVDTLFKEANQNNYMFIEGQQQAFRHYIQKLKSLNKGFITTTFLGSSFWWIPDDQYHIIEDNIETAKRLNEKEEEEPIKRLILLEEPIDQFIKRTVNKIVEDKRRRNTALETKWNTTIRQLKEMNKCITMKLFMPETSPFWKKLLNTEIACYEDKEFDYFTCDRENNILGVEIYFDYKKCSDDKKKREIVSLINTFNEVWSGSNTIPLKEFIEKFEEELEKASHRISYKKDWLLWYLKDYNKEDKKLKDAEMTELLEMIAGKKFKRYLDIGEGSGRYPIMFAERNIADYIIGIDFDPKCNESAKFETEAKSLNITHVCEDIMDYENGEFDIITCMMGTISHISEQNNLENFVKKLKKITNKDGVIYLSIWNKAKKERDFLSIYNNYEKDRLIKNSPNADELKKLFEEYNFKINKKKKVHRLTLFEVKINGKK